MKKKPLLYIRESTTKKVDLNNQEKILKRHLGATGIEPTYVMATEGITINTLKTRKKSSN